MTVRIDHTCASCHRWRPYGGRRPDWGICSPSARGADLSHLTGMSVTVETGADDGRAAAMPLPAEAALETRHDFGCRLWLAGAYAYAHALDLLRARHAQELRDPESEPHHDPATVYEERADGHSLFH